MHIDQITDVGELCRRYHEQQQAKGMGSLPRHAMSKTEFLLV